MGLFNSSILEVVIGVIFVYLLLSILCTSANEWAATLTRRRAKMLRQGIEQLLADQPLRRMIFVKGSPPGEKIATMSKGDSLHVLGVPRVNLNEVFAIANGMSGHDEYAFGGLPYEIIIVALLKD